MQNLNGKINRIHLKGKQIENQESMVFVRFTKILKNFEQVLSDDIESHD